MRQITEDLIAVAEVLMGHLCNANVQPFADLPIQVVELPEEQRANKLLRLSYGFYQGDQIVRFG